MLFPVAADVVPTDPGLCRHPILQ